MIHTTPSSLRLSTELPSTIWESSLATRMTMGGTTLVDPLARCCSATARTPCPLSRLWNYRLKYQQIVYHLHDLHKNYVLPCFRSISVSSSLYNSASLHLKSDKHSLFASKSCLQTPSRISSARSPKARK